MAIPVTFAILTTLAAFAPLLIIMVIFYVLLILPAQRRQKKTQQMLSALKNGDKVKVMDFSELVLASLDA